MKMCILCVSLHGQLTSLQMGGEVGGPLPALFVLFCFLKITYFSTLYHIKNTKSLNLLYYNYKLYIPNSITKMVH